MLITAADLFSVCVCLLRRSPFSCTNSLPCFLVHVGGGRRLRRRLKERGKARSHAGKSRCMHAAEGERKRW